MIKKTGFLLPRSVLYPTINFDLLEGMRTGLEANEQPDITITTDNIGIGANDQQIYNSCERMLMDGYTVIAGYVNPNTALKLQSLFSSANAIFLCIDAGYQFMLPDPQVLPNVISVSLQGTLCCRASVTLAMNAGFDSFAFTSSFLDAGYRPGYAYARAIEKGGAAINFNHVATLRRQDFTIEPLTTFITNEPQSAIIAAYCGDMLYDFCAHASKSGATFNNLFVSPFMLEETWLEQSVYPGADMHGVVTWAKDLDNPVNTRFKKSLEDKGRVPNIFSVLGYETGQIVAQLSRNGKQGAAGVAALGDWAYESPRGTVSIDGHTHQTIPPLYYAKGIRNEANGHCKLQVTSMIDQVTAHWTGLQEDIHSLTGSTTNWFNTYPCIES